MVSQSSGKCIDVPMNVADQGLALQQWDCGGGPQQSYRFNDQGNGTLQIQTSNDVCVDSLGQGGPVAQWTCNGGANQSWYLWQQDDNSYVLQNVGNGLCMNVAGNSTDNGGSLITWDCNSQSNEKFQVNGSGLSAPISSPAPTSNGPTLIGVGPMNYEQYSHEVGVQAFQNFLGRGVDFGLDFLDDRSWSGLVSDANYGTQGWHDLNPNRQVMWSVPLTVGPHGCGACGTPLSEVAAGGHDWEFNQVANAISQRQPNAVIRIGWEFNTRDYAWSVVDGHEADYRDAFRHVVQIFRAVNPNFRFVWCPLILNRDEENVENAYPGDDVVDLVGVDYYDDNWGSADDRWNYTLSSTNGLQWHVDFSNSHGKQMTVPEWGAGRAGDSPSFIHRMGSWFRDHHYASQAYWEGFDGSGYNAFLENNQFPQQSEAYISEFR